MKLSHCVNCLIQEANQLTIYYAIKDVTCKNCNRTISENELFSRSADKAGRITGIKYTWCRICQPIDAPDVINYPDVILNL